MQFFLKWKLLFFVISLKWPKYQNTCCGRKSRESGDKKCKSGDFAQPAAALPPQGNKSQNHRHFQKRKTFKWLWWQALEQFCWWFTLASLSLYYFARLSVIQGDEHKHEHYPWEADHQSGVGLSVGSLSYRDQRPRVDPSSCQIPTPFIAIHVICLNSWEKVWNSEHCKHCRLYQHTNCKEKEGFRDLNTAASWFCLKHFFFTLIPGRHFAYCFQFSQ